MADASEPPLPNVVNLDRLFIPWKPVTIGIPPDFKYFFKFLIKILYILALEYGPSVKIGT